jgi:hypothetical protein
MFLYAIRVLKEFTTKSNFRVKLTQTVHLISWEDKAAENLITFLHEIPASAHSMSKIIIRWSAIDDDIQSERGTAMQSSPPFPGMTVG